MLDKINMGTIWTMLVATAVAIAYMFNTFAHSEDLKKHEQEYTKQMNQFSLDIAYGQYYDRLDDFDEAKAEGNEALAAEYSKQMERLKAKICKLDEEWERCND